MLDFESGINSAAFAGLGIDGLEIGNWSFAAPDIEIWSLSLDLERLGFELFSDFLSVDTFLSI